MKILKTILSQLLIIFKMIPESTRKSILIYLMEEFSKRTGNKIDDKLVKKVKESFND